MEMFMKESGKMEKTTVERWKRKMGLNDGSSYEGDWENGQRHGQGMDIFMKDLRGYIFGKMEKETVMGK